MLTYIAGESSSYIFITLPFILDNGSDIYNNMHFHAKRSQLILPHPVCIHKLVGGLNFMNETGVYENQPIGSINSIRSKLTLLTDWGTSNLCIYKFQLYVVI
jgi:hypothetical protein